jgi:hypothetical protein
MLEEDPWIRKGEASHYFNMTSEDEHICLIVCFSRFLTNGETVLSTLSSTIVFNNDEKKPLECSGSE